MKSNNHRRQLQSKLAEKKKSQPGETTLPAPPVPTPLQSAQASVQEMTNVPTELVEQLRKATGNRKLNQLEKITRIPEPVLRAVNTLPPQYRECVSSYLMLCVTFVLSQDLIWSTLVQSSAANETELSRARAHIADLEARVVKLQNTCLALTNAWIPPIENTDEEQIREVRDNHLAMAQCLNHGLPPDQRVDIGGAKAGRECPICLDECDSNTNAACDPWGHGYCKDCIKPMVEHGCAICRSKPNKYLRVFV